MATGELLLVEIAPFRAEQYTFLNISGTRLSDVPIIVLRSCLLILLRNNNDTVIVTRVWNFF